MSFDRRALWMLVVLLGAAGGCAYGDPWFSPGPTAIQQRRAVLFDPYPDQDAGPEVVGGRPRDYQKPPTEPVRAQQRKPPFGIFGGQGPMAPVVGPVMMAP